MIRAERLWLKVRLLVGLTLIVVSLAGCDIAAAEGTQPLAQLGADQLQQLPAFLLDFGRQVLAAWLL